MIDFSLTPQQNKMDWRSVDERKASEPSGLHSSHHKCASMDKQMNKVDTFLRSFPIEMGFAPKAWEPITDVEILKRHGKFHVDQMQLVQLMNAEFQINNKNLGRRYWHSSTSDFRFSSWNSRCAAVLFWTSW